VRKGRKERIKEFFPFAGGGPVRRSLFLVRPRFLSLCVCVCVCGCGEGESEGRQKAAGACATHSRAAAACCLPRSERLRPLCACLPSCCGAVLRCTFVSRNRCPDACQSSQSWTQLLSGLQTVKMPCRAIISCSVPPRMCTRIRCEMPCRAWPLGSGLVLPRLAAEVWLTWRRGLCKTGTVG
jgi:hypothetical protein